MDGCLIQCPTLIVGERISPPLNQQACANTALLDLIISSPSFVRCSLSASKILPIQSLSIYIRSRGALGGGSAMYLLAKENQY